MQALKRIAQAGSDCFATRCAQHQFQTGGRVEDDQSAPVPFFPNDSRRREFARIRLARLQPLQHFFERRLFGNFANFANQEVRKGQSGQSGTGLQPAMHGIGDMSQLYHL